MIRIGGEFMKKILMVFGGIALAIIVFVVAIFMIVSFTSKKLVCKSAEGNITIMYNDETITGYTASGITYDLDGQKQIAERIGIESYLEQFSTWFKTNTTGTCKK